MIKERGDILYSASYMVKLFFIALFSLFRLL